MFDSNVSADDLKEFRHKFRTVIREEICQDSEWVGQMVEE